ncbi:MAG: tetratricopeptide repeat protein [Candidatus Contendobacter sp.]|nr:tetratricopeptide repeat protein [Candidatus Contendobacter sp.]
MPAHLHAPLILQPPADLASRFPHVLSLAQQLSLKYVHRYVVTEQDLQTVGDALWQTLGADEALAAARQAAGTRILPLILESADSLVQSLPWECLHHPEHGFLGKHPGFSLTRRLSAAPSAAAEPPKGPLKVLLFTALPDDLDQEKERLDTESEQANVLEALDPLIHQGLVQLTTPDDGRFDHFRQLLREQEFHLVFLSGHGKFNADPLLGPTGAWFWFEGADGRSHPVEGKELAQAFSGTAVQAVVLSACQSGKSASVDLGSSLATRLLHAGLPQVVGMRESILDVAGIHFAHALCKALGRQERLDVALQAAREAIAEAPALAGPRKDLSGATEWSRGQWCLPLLYSRDPAQPLIDWQFQPVPLQPPLERYHDIAGMPLPAAFIGRRRELRELGQIVYGGRPGQCLLTGAGGQGKTSLAGRLAQRLEACDWLVRAYTARQENNWKDFVTELQFCLAESLREQVNRALLRCRTETDKARLILRALLQQTGNKLALVFDNLETLQDPATGRITDDAVAAWLDACKPVGSDPAPVVLVTSRWAIPGWEDDRRVQRPLGPPLYGDFLRYHQQLGGAPWGAERLRRLYEALGGNFKGLEFFHALNQVAGDDEAFLQQLEHSRKKLQLHMMVEKLVGYLQPDERELLNRLRAYLAPTFANGVRIIAQGLAEPERLLQRLVGLSLVDVEMEPTLDLPRYRLSPVVADWLQAHEPEPASDIRQGAARYQRWVFENLLETLEQALIAHEALRQSGLEEEAARFALGTIVPYFDRIGLYHTLLKEWLPALRENQNQELRARALNQSGKTCLHVSQYDEAKLFLEDSLALRRAIGDRAGEGATLNNLSQIYDARGDYDTALRYLEESLALQRAIGDRAGEGATLSNLSGIYQVRGDYDTALRYLEDSLALQRAIGDRSGEGATLNNLSQIYDARGDYDTALRYLEDSLAIFRTIGDRAGEGTTLGNLSALYRARGDLDTALCHLEESLAICRAISDRVGEGRTLNNLSQVYKARGDLDTALRYLEESLTLQRAIGNRLGEGTTLNNLSQIYKARRDYDTALRYLEESLTIQRAIGDRVGLCVTLFNMGHIYLQKCEHQQALACFVPAYQIAKAIGYAEALMNLENLAKQLGGSGLEYWERLSQQMESGE